MFKYSIIDVSKGVLIILVIIGHFLLGNLEENIIRYIIYGFHMPIFFVVSGWLFKYKKYSVYSALEMFEKYKYRVLIPWMIAAIIYNMINILLLNQEFQFIYYHLWFIPSYIFCILSVWILSKARLSITFISLIAVVIFLVFTFVNCDLTLYNLVDNNLRPSYFLYFVLGIVIREKQIKRSPIYLYLIFIFLISYILSYYAPLAIPRLLMGLPLCFSISLYMFSHLDTTINLPVIKWVGINSMGIYLWHMLPIILSKYLFEDNLHLYYTSTILFMCVFFILYRYLNRISIFQKYFFGL